MNWIRRALGLVILYLVVVFIVPVIQSYDFKNGLNEDYFSHWFEGHFIPSYDTTKIEKVYSSQETNIDYSLGSTVTTEGETVLNSEYEGDFVIKNEPGAFHMLLVRDGELTGGYTNSPNVSLGKMSIDKMTREKARDTYGEPVEYVRKQWKRLKVENEEYDVFDVGNYYVYFFYDIHESYQANGMLVLHKDEIIDISELYNHPSIEDNELMHYYLLNATRYEYGYGMLERNAEVDNVAYYHSLDMAERKFFDHDNPDGNGLKERLERENVRYTYAGENIATGHTSPIFAHHSLLNSPSHRVNILNDKFTSVGIGIEYDQEQVPFYTENFLQ
ncbi:CAP domain-containing protein [Jeotgalicoccus huakuii]|nr:CAP domain-containing protein [Jeotgalicoccus huakuii]